jgi:uncharacterized membrane protein
MNDFLISIFLTLLPIMEMRYGLPFVILAAKNNSIPTFLAFLLTLTLNILLIFFIFFFLDTIHKQLLKLNFYNKFTKKILTKLQKKVDKIENKINSIGYLALTLFVAIPLPVTGIYSASLISWVLDLERKKAIPAIIFGLMIISTIVYLGTIGIISSLN